MATTVQTAERLARLLGPGARTRAMMGEYVLYWRDRVVGGLYDARLLLKDVAAVREAAPDSPLEEPYPGPGRCDVCRFPTTSTRPGYSSSCSRPHGTRCRRRGGAEGSARRGPRWPK